MKTTIFLFLVLLFQFYEVSAFTSKCVKYYELPKYSFSNFMSDLKEHNKYTNDYNQKSDLLIKLVSLNSSKMDSDEFLKTSLYIINRATNFINDYGIYSEGVVRVVSKIVESSHNVKLDFEQAQALRIAIADRPGFLWRRSSDITNMIALSKSPLGIDGHMAPQELPLSPNVRNIKAIFAKNWRFTRDYNDTNNLIGVVLNEYASQMTAEDFTSISIWLVRWKLRYGSHYWGMNGEYMVKGYEKIRQASLQVNLSNEQIEKIKSAMRNQSRSFSELLYVFPLGIISSLQGWNDRDQLGTLLNRPFGHIH